MCFSTLECVNLSNTPLIFEKYGIIFKMNDSEMKWHLLTNFLLTKIHEQRVNENFIKWSICWLISLKCVLRISFTVLNFVTFSYINWNTSMLYDHYIIDWKFHEIYIINFYFCFEKTISIEYYEKIAIIIGLINFYT